jgi:hypothetical protein
MNRNNLNKAGWLILAAAFLFAFTQKADKANFSGSWSLNEGKSELGDFGARITPKKIKVEQKDDAITITKISSFNGNEMSTDETLSFDGKTSETTAFGNSKKKSTAKWSEDGQTLTVSYSIAFDRGGQTMEITGTETWTLANDGKNLSLVTVSSSPQGERTLKAMYDKE